MSKHVFRGLAVLFLVVLATMLLAVPVSAAELRGLEDVTIESGEVIDDDLYVAASTITINGTVNGDLWAAGGTLNINGTVSGDVVAAVSTLNIDGEVGQTVRVVGMAININGSIGGDLMIGGNNVTIGSSAVIGGDLSYFSNNDAEIGSGAIIAGTISHNSTKLGWPFKWGLLANILVRVFAFLMILLIGIVIVVLAPRRMALMANTIKAKPWFSLGWGAILLFGTPIAAIIVCFTIVGIPLALIALVLYGIAIYLAQIPVALFIGRWIIGYFAKTDSRGVMVGALALGLAILCLLRMIPYVGVFIWLAAVLFGLGGALVSLRK